MTGIRLRYTGGVGTCHGTEGLTCFKIRQNEQVGECKLRPVGVGLQWQEYLIGGSQMALSLRYVKPLPNLPVDFGITLHVLRAVDRVLARAQMRG